MAKKVSKKGKGSYLKYKTEARLAKNKAKRAAAHEKRMARFAARRAAGKAYEYKPIEAKKGTREYEMEVFLRSCKNVTHKTELQRFTSVMKHVDNLLTKRKEEARHGEGKNK